MTPNTEYLYRLIDKGYNTPKKLMAATDRVKGTISNQLMYLEATALSNLALKANSFSLLVYG